MGYRKCTCTKVLYGRVLHGNQASVRVLEENGYQYETEEFGAEDDPYNKGKGGLDYDKMKFFPRLMMKVFASGLQKKQDATEAEKIQAEMISKSFDAADEKFIEPIVDYLTQSDK